MKRLGLIGGLMVLLLAACTSHSETRHGTSLPYASSPELAAIDSLMWRQPDSALTCLLTCFDTCSATEYNRHYANLLFAELLYKNDYEQTNREELQRTVAYFDSLVGQTPPLKRGWRIKKNPSATTFLTARSHYINGVGYYENGSAVEACKEYLTTLEMMEEYVSEKELAAQKTKFIALTYTHLSSLFSDFYLHEQSVYFGKKALEYYQKQETPFWHQAWVLNEIGSQFDIMEQFDSATCYYQNAINILDDTISLTYKDIVGHLICLEYKKGTCQAETTINKLHQLLLSSDSDRESQTRFINIGEIYYHEHEYDSAWVYLNRVFQTTSVVGFKKQAAEWLVEICKSQGKYTEAHKFADFLVPYANVEENQSTIKSQLTELNKAFGLAQQEREQKKEMQRHRNHSIAVVVGWFLITIIIFVLLYYFHKQHKQHLEEQIEAERQAHKIQQAALAGRLKQSNRAQKEQLKHNEKPVFNLKQPKANTYEEEPICQLIISVCNDGKNVIKSTVSPSAYASIALTDAQKAELKSAAFAHYASLIEMLGQQHPELKEKDFMYCYLCLLGLDNMQIAVMLQHSLSTIWDREKRLKKVLGSEDRVAVTLHSLMAN